MTQKGIVMQKKKEGYGFLIKWLIVLGDLIILNGLFILVFQCTKTDPVSKLNDNWQACLLMVNFCYCFSVQLIPIWIYKPIIYADKVVQRSFSLVTTYSVLLIACLFFLYLDSSDFPVRLIIYYYIGLFLLFPLWRFYARELLKKYRRYGRNYKRIIIVGAGKNGLTLHEEIKKDMAYGFQISGFFDDNLALKQSLPNYLGKTDEVEDFVLKHHIDEIYCTLPNSQDNKIIRLLNFAEKHMIRFYLIPEFSRYVKRHLTLENIESLPVLAVRSEPLQTIHNQFIKRTFDIVFSFLFLCSLFPFVYIVMGTMIKLSSPGPVFFKQKRTGLYGKDFYCYKFRSMRKNKDANEKQAIQNDPRITKIGRFLRRSNMDELPQFFNVLKGDMSIVGPRPHMLKHTEIYSTIIDKYMVRHLIKPGITGWAQINGYRGETRLLEQMETRVRYDVWYLENWTFFLDLKIICVTILNMFRGEKNAF